LGDLKRAVQNVAPITAGMAPPGCLKSNQRKHLRIRRSYLGISRASFDD